MRQLPAEKYNVAWFKLAEFVARGEKERALGLYRLLAHAFESKALAYQLEGDLLSLFGDEQAMDRYAVAATLYVQENKVQEAIMLYEYVLSINPVSAKDHFLSKLNDDHEPVYQQVCQRSYAHQLSPA